MPNKTLCQANLCSMTFSALGWSKEQMHEAGYPIEVMAIASYVKTHRVNIDNVAEVIAIMWPLATTSVRKEGRGSNGTGYEIAVDVVFPDGSSGLMMSDRGIFEEFETMGWAERE